MGCDYFHAQLSCLHLQAQHLHTGIELCVLFVWVLTHCLRLCNFQCSPTSWSMPRLAVEQCCVLPACPHLLRSPHSRGNWKKSEVLSESSHSKHWEVQTAFQTWTKWSMHGKHPRSTSNVSHFSLQGLEWWPKGHSTHPPSPAPLQGALHLFLGLSHTTSHNKYLYFSETIHLCSSLHFYS